MQSRTSRYHNEEVTEKRSEKNKNLYNQIYQDADYSNIENVVNMEKTNEINLQKIREMLNRGEIKKEIPESTSEIKEEKQEEQLEHDIKKILDVAKGKREDSDLRRKSLGDTNYNILKNLRIEKRCGEGEKENLQDIIDKMANTKMLNDLNTQELSEKILSDISNCSTKTVKTEEMIDKSFYTTGMKFKEKDFEEKKALSQQQEKETIKKSNRFATFALVIVVLIMVGLLGIIFFRILDL